jgi:hypothetical protein
MLRFNNNAAVLAEDSKNGQRHPGPWLMGIIVFCLDHEFYLFLNSRSDYV